VIIDEIGKMECLSPLFRKTLIETLDSPNRVIGSIGQWGDTFMEKIKKRKDLLLVPISADNRDFLTQQLIEQIRG
jgi:nucleoside-triphosphatase